MDDELRRRLQQAAERLPEGRADLGAVTRAGQRSRAVRLAGSLAAAAVLAIIAVLAGTGVFQAPKSGAGDTRAAVKQPTEEACRYVEARPTYLPWLARGEEVPEPRMTVENDTSYVSWTDDANGSSHQKSVTLRRNSEPLGGAGQPVSQRLEGAVGYYYDGPGSQAAVLWKTDAGRCGLITLSLSLPRVNQEELREEILKVVRSLKTTSTEDQQTTGEEEQLADGPRWLGQVLTRAGLSFRNDFRPDGGGGHSIDSLRMILWSTNPTRATAREEAERWGYEEIWSGAGPTVFGANRAESPTAYLYWRAGGVDTFAQVDKEPWSQSIAGLELAIREIIRQQERYPYPDDASTRGGGRRDLTRPGHYELSDFDYSPTNDGRATRVAYTISWSGESFPGTDEGCFVIVQTKQGTKRFGPFSITSADPRAEGANEIPVAADEIENVYVECAANRKK